MSEELRSIIQTQHPQLADEMRIAIHAMQKVLELTGPLPGAGLGIVSESKASGIHETRDTVPANEIGATLAPGAPSQQFIQANPPTLAAGEAFGRYQITKLLGKGAMGSVYLAYDQRLDRHVAIKIPFFRDNQTGLERFYIEARAAAMLRSPNICPIYDVAQINGVHYISMAFIDGRSLAKEIEDGPMDPKETATIIAKTAGGIQKAHERGIIHRDIKPDNIMIDEDGEPVVMDFGLARRTTQEDARLTINGALLGSPAYMSPEQANGEHDTIGPGTDIFSLGVVLYQMLTAKLPFEGSLMTLLKRIVNEKPPPPSKHVPSLAGSAIEKICLRMMEKSPADRFSSMEEVARAAGDPASYLATRTGKRRRFFGLFGRS